MNRVLNKEEKGYYVNQIAEMVSYSLFLIINNRGKSIYENLEVLLAFNRTSIKDMIDMNFRIV